MVFVEMDGKGGEKARTTHVGVRGDLRGRPAVGVDATLPVHDVGAPDEEVGEVETVEGLHGPLRRETATACGSNTAVTPSMIAGNVSSDWFRVDAAGNPFEFP